MNKSILITGASSDIGKGLIETIHNNYDIIIAHYHTMNPELEKLKQKLQDKMILLQADFAEEESVLNLIQSIKSMGNYPDHIVHLAAVKYEYQKFEKAKWQSFELGIHTSVRSAVMILKAFCPEMKKKHYGKVIFMLTSSVVGKPPRFTAPYVMQKYALMGLMNSLAVEYADKGITFNSVSPGMVETKFLDQIPDYIIQKNAEESPLGRNLRTEDLLPLFEFLLSQGSDCMTGENIVIAGGNS